MTTDLFDDEEDTETPERDNATQAQARLDREKAKLKKEIDELRAWKAEREQADKAITVKTAFTEAGLNPKWAKFYQGEDVTPDALKAWAVAEDFIQVSEGEEVPEPAAPPATGFTPTVIEGSTTLGSKMYTADEFAQLMAADPRKAEAIYKAGKLKKDEPEWSYSSRFYGRDT